MTAQQFAEFINEQIRKEQTPPEGVEWIRTQFVRETDWAKNFLVSCCEKMAWTGGVDTFVDDTTALFAEAAPLLKAPKTEPFMSDLNHHCVDG